MRVAADHRSAILKTAARLFARKRFHEVLMEDVAAQVGVAKGTIYRFYPTKERLYAAICFEWMDTLQQELQVAAHGSGDAAARLREMLFRSARHYDERRDFYQVMARQETLQVFYALPAFLERRAAIRDLYSEVIREGRARRIFRGVSPVLTADLLLGMLRNLFRFGDARRSPEAVARTILDLFLHGIAANRRAGTNGAPAAARSHGRPSAAPRTSTRRKGRPKA